MNKRKKDFLAFLKKENISKKVIDAFGDLDQKVFFDPIFKDYYYSDEPIPIGHSEKSESQTALARMISYLCPETESRVLEIGTGSGYSTAILSRLFREVITVEYYEDLALAAKEKISGLKINNVRFLAGDITGLKGIPGIFDRIIIFAAFTSRPLFLMPHLKNKGIMVFPMGPVYQQQITVLKNEPAGENVFKMDFNEMCVFGPLKNA